MHMKSRKEFDHEKNLIVDTEYRLRHEHKQNLTRSIKW